MGRTFSGLLPFRPQTAKVGRVGIYRLLRLCGPLLGLALALLPVRAAAADAALGPGSRIDALPVGPTTYRQVQVRSVNARTVLITHAGGMASIHLRELAPEWQARFHYDPAAAAAADAAEPALSAPAARPGKPEPARSVSKFDQLLQHFGQPAEVKSGVDLRPKFFELDLGVKNQGRRPSCAIFAVVSALEFQNAELAGRVEKFSEEYLIWAVRKTVQRLPAAAAPADETGARDNEDEGYALAEVVDALRAYGIPLQSSMPNTFGSNIRNIPDPPPAVVEEARTHQRVFVHRLPGRDTVTRINNLVQALNAGVPVAIGIGWPNYRTLRGGFLDGQKPVTGSGHAVTLVGYTSATGRLEDTVFIFKNSYGAEWGQGGYGTVTYAYLRNYLNDAVLLEVQAGKAS